MKKKTLLVVLTCILCWLLMQAVHEFGHVLGAIITGGQVERVVLNPISISRTDVSPNPHPMIVVWAGPIVGVILPFAIWALVLMYGVKTRFGLFFSGFCFIANGLYIGLGSFEHIGDAGEMIHHGSPIWILWIFGIVSLGLGFLLWHFLGPGFGIRKMESKDIDRGLMRIGSICIAYCVLTFLFFR